MDPRAYVTEQLSLIIGTPVTVDDNAIHRFWEAFARTEERHERRDAHGNVPPDALSLVAQGLQECPPLHDEIAALQRQSTPLLPRWPNGHRFAACLTHDVDRIVQLPWRERWRQLATLRHDTPVAQQLRWTVSGTAFAVASAVGCSNLAPFDAWMAEERRHGFHSTFFVLPERLLRPTHYDHYYRYGDPITYDGKRTSFTDGARLAAQAGWEIGLHGSYASAWDETILRAERAQAEALLDGPIRSVRQHFLRYDCDTTPHIQAAVGIKADSTIGFNTTIGCRAGMAFPYFWPGEDELLEVPLIIQDVGLLRVHGKHLDLPSAIRRAQALITCIAEVGGVATLSWHTHPESPGAHEAYRALLQTIAELDGWGCSLGELNDWWRTRRTTIRQRLKEDADAHNGKRGNCSGVIRAHGAGSPGI